MIVKVNVGGQEFEVQIEDLNQRPVIARIGEDTFEVWPEAASQPVAAVAPASIPHGPVTGLQTNHKAKSIHSPLPGTATEVFIQPGDAVKTGDILLVIEAMKMKNSIRASQDGKVAAVHIHSGQTVQHKQLLVDFE